MWEKNDAVKKHPVYIASGIIYMILVRRIVVSLKQQIFRFDPMPDLAVSVVNKVCGFVCSTGCVWAAHETWNLFYLHAYLATNANSVTAPHHFSITVRGKKKIFAIWQSNLSTQN